VFPEFDGIWLIAADFAHADGKPDQLI